MHTIAAVQWPQWIIRYVYRCVCTHVQKFDWRSPSGFAGILSTRSVNDRARFSSRLLPKFSLLACCNTFHVSCQIPWARVNAAGSVAAKILTLIKKRWPRRVSRRDPISRSCGERTRVMSNYRLIHVRVRFCASD